MHPINSAGSARHARFFLSQLLPISLLILFALGCASSATTSDAEATDAPSATTRPSKETTEVTERRPAMKLEAVYFDTDDERLRGDARRVLVEHAQAVAEHPQWGVITVEGHCDERGSDAYNHALGQRRAESVQRFLVANGVPKSRIEIRTLGADQPTVAGHGEHAWKMNRRSEFRRETLISNNL